MRRLRAAIEPILRGLVSPVARSLASSGFTPNQVTMAGLAIALLAAMLIAAGQLVAGGIVFLIASLMDLLDGVLAREHEGASEFGAFLDSTLDRLGEGLVFTAVTLHFAWNDDPWLAALTVLALIGAFLTSYTRARAEALGLECRVGIVTRPERVLILGVGLIAGLAAPAVWVLALLGAFTTAQRVAETYRQAGLDADDGADSGV